MFITRHPVVENQFCSFGSQTGSGSEGVGGVLCYAGSVMYLDSDATNEESIVMRYDTFAAKPTETSELVPFGFSMQKVKTGYHQVHPTGFVMPGDLGSSDAIAQPSYDSNGNITGTKAVPVGVAHMGIWDTVHYTCKHSANVVTAGDHMKPGDYLYASCNSSSRVTNHATDATDDTLTYERIVDVAVARVIKGASAGKASATIANTTLYPIRIKLLI